MRLTLTIATNVAMIASLDPVSGGVGEMILEKIRQLYPQLTKSQRRIADFIATSYKEAAFMTAARLATKLAVNEATIIRFAQRLGYPGYPELIDEIQALVQEELKASYESPTVLGTQETFLRALISELETLHRALSHLSPQLTHEAQRIIAEARRTYVVGQGISWPLAQLLGLSLRSLGLSAEEVPADPLSLAIMLGELNERCALVCILAAADSPELANALRQASQKGAHTLTLSWSPVSACAQAAEVTLSYPANDSFAVPSIATIAALIDALVQSLATQDIERVQSYLRATEETRELIFSRRRR